MHIPARRRPEFDEARVYEYPEHLRDSLLDMPALSQGLSSTATGELNIAAKTSKLR